MKGMSMKRNKISLGTSNRPSPTSGYVRKRASFAQIGRENDGEALPKNSSTKPNSGNSGGGPVPLRGGPPTPRRKLWNENEFLAAWRQLDRIEQRAVLAKMSLELQNTSSDEDAREVDMWSEAVYEALRATLGPSDGPGHGPQV